MEFLDRRTGRGGLLRQLAFPFTAFILTATLAMVGWIDVTHRRESLRQFAETARSNARFVEHLRLPRSPELAENLASVLGVQVGFYRSGEKISGLPAELIPVVKRHAGSETISLRSGRWDLSVAPIAEESTRLVLVREADSFFPVTATWLLPTLIVTALGGGLASLVARRIVHPLATLTRWLPNLDLDDPEALPEGVTGRTDEIGTLARSLEQSSQRLRKEVALRQQAERLAALGRIATSLAHEVRNPAAAIRLHADLLASNFDSLDTDSLDLIREEVDRITDLVNQWLYVARSAPPRTELHDLALLVRRVLHRLAPQFDHASVTASFAGDQYAPIQADAPRIEQVLRNLFINAMQAMPEGGAIRTEIEHDATGTTLEIHDEGPGFSEEACRRWHEPFFSEREGGMGLGLTLAAEVMLGHGGTIGVSNQPGGGTVVRCQFPHPDKMPEKP